MLFHNKLDGADLLDSTKEVLPHTPIAHVYTKGHYHIYVDGSGGNKDNPCSSYGVAILVGPIYSCTPNPAVELVGGFGSCVYGDGAQFVGAQHHSNNAGELNAVIWALLFVHSHCSAVGGSTYTIHFNSTYSGRSTWWYYSV